MVRIFFILQIKKCGNILTSLQSLIITLIHRLPDIKTNYTIFRVKDIIQLQIADLNITEPKNLEEQALSLVGRDVYEKLIKGYTEKQWGRDCKDLPAFIIKRLPLRFTYDNNYFNDRYQGIPIGGYTAIIEKMLEGTEVLLNTDYKEFTAKNGQVADKVLYTGMIDEYYDYKLGVLENSLLQLFPKSTRVSGIREMNLIIR